MEKISELFEYLEKTKDDDIRYQLIDFMKEHHKFTAVWYGSTNPINRYKLSLRRLMNQTRNLADLIKYCFENDIKMVIKELNTNQEQHLNFYTLQTLATKLDVSINTLNNATKSGALKYYTIRGIGEKNESKRFSPEQVDDYLRNSQK